MKKILFILVSTCFCTVVFSQKADHSAKYAATITASDLKTHLSILASDEYEGRETGKAGQKKAAEYLATHFEKSGLKPLNGNSFFQVYDVNEKILGKRILKANQREFKAGEDFLFSKDKELIHIQSNEILFAGYGIKDENYNSFSDVDVKGKVIMIIAGEPYVNGKYVANKNPAEKSKWSNKNKKIAELQKLEPLAILYIEPEYSKNSRFYKHQLEKVQMRLDYKSKENKDVPVITINTEIANELLKPNKRTFEKLFTTLKKFSAPQRVVIARSTLDVHIQIIDQKLSTENVIAYVPGTDLKDEYLFVTAHYDHIGVIDGKVHNGADDDGSGTVALLEMADAFMQASKAGNGPRRSIVFMAVSGEEKGLLGSQYYVDHPVVPLSSTVVNLNIDMIGRLDDAHKKDTDYVYIIGSDKLSSKLHEVNEAANKKHLNINMDYKYNDPKDPNMFYYRSDHYNFAKNNIPIIFYFNGVHEDYHKEGDEVEKIHFPMLTRRTKLVFHTAWELANMDERIKVDKNNDFPAER